MDSLFQVHRDHLAPILAKAGYVKVKSLVLKNGAPLSLEFRWDEDNPDGLMLGPSLTPSAIMYYREAYPNGTREECFFHTYNACGSSSKRRAQVLVGFMRQAGITCRTTVKGGDQGVAFIPNYDVYAEMNAIETAKRLKNPG